jgi:hypothetical protein
MLPGDGGEVVRYRAVILSDGAAFVRRKPAYEGNQGKIALIKKLTHSGEDWHEPF